MMPTLNKPTLSITPKSFKYSINFSGDTAQGSGVPMETNAECQGQRKGNYCGGYAAGDIPFDVAERGHLMSLGEGVLSH